MSNIDPLEKIALEKIAHKLLQKGMSVEEVASVTELPIERVQYLHSQLSDI